MGTIRLNKRRKDKEGKQRYIIVTSIGNGRRKVEPLEIYDAPRASKAERNSNKELALQILDLRRREQTAIANGMSTPEMLDADFVVFFDALFDRKYAHDRSWRSARKHLHDFTGGKDSKGGSLTFRSLTKAWFTRNKAYLATKVATSTARTYFSKIKAALGQAVEFDVIASNPASAVKNFAKGRGTRDEIAGPKKRALTRDEIARVRTKPIAVHRFQQFRRDRVTGR